MVLCERKCTFLKIFNTFLAHFGYQTAPFDLPPAWTNMVLKISTKDTAYQPLLKKVQVFLQFSSRVLPKPCHHILHGCIALLFSMRLLNSIVDTCTKRQCCMITAHPYFTALILHEIFKGRLLRLSETRLRHKSIVADASFLHDSAYGIQGVRWTLTV